MDGKEKNDWKRSETYINENSETNIIALFIHGQLMNKDLFLNNSFLPIIYEVLQSSVAKSFSDSLPLLGILLNVMIRLLPN